MFSQVLLFQQFLHNRASSHMILASTWRSTSCTKRSYCYPGSSAGASAMTNYPLTHTHTHTYMTSAENLKLAKAQKPTLSSSIFIRVVSPSESKRKGFALGTLPTQVKLHDAWWSTVPAKIYSPIWRLQIKKINETCQD